ncbi:MAG: hypothetical protein V3V67_09445 [Myxococcota bacterium]
MRCEIEAASPADAPSLAHPVSRALPEAWSETALRGAACALYDDFGFAIQRRRPRDYAGGEDTLLLGAEP